jgi:hypothetical protein
MNLQQAYMMAKGGKWIQSAIKRPGALTKKAQAAGMGVQEFANTVSSNPEEYSPRTRRQANLAKTLKKIRKGEDGMEVPEDDMEMEPIEALDPKLEWAKKDLQRLEKEAEKENVREYQRMLNRKYGAGLAEDGAWGKNTQAAYEKYILAKKASPASKEPNPMTKNPEKDLPNFERMDQIEIKVKKKPEPPTLLPKRPIPQIQPKLADYMGAPRKAVDTRSYSDNTRVNNNFRPVTSVPKAAQPAPKKTMITQPSFNQAPTGYRSAGYLDLLERMKNGQMKNGGMKKKY